MEYTAEEIAKILNGTIEGNPKQKVNKLSKIEEGEMGSLTFLANPKYNPYIYTTKASIVITNKDFKAEQKINCTLIRVENAYTAFAQLLEMYNKIKHDIYGISKHASISESTTIGKDAYIGDFVFIGKNVKIGDKVKIYPQTFIGNNVKIGDNTIIFSGVKIYDDTVIGNNCTVHAGVVIGSDGFGFAPQNDKHYKKVAQIGNVVIEDYVEIGSNTCIDKATLGSTIIRKGVKLDNLIQIAHNVEIGENTVIAAQTGISGSTKIGKNCLIGGQVGIVGHIEIADGVMIEGQSGIQSSIKQKGLIVQGSPAFEIKKYRKSYVHFKNLHEIVNRLNILEK